MKIENLLLRLWLVHPNFLSFLLSSGCDSVWTLLTRAVETYLLINFIFHHRYSSPEGSGYSRQCEVHKRRYGCETKAGLEDKYRREDVFGLLGTCCILMCNSFDIFRKIKKKDSLPFIERATHSNLKLVHLRVGLSVVPYSLLCYNLRLSQSPMLKGKAQNSLRCRCTSTQSKYTNRAPIAVCVQLSSSFGAD